MDISKFENRVDLEGKLVTPGIGDAHVHVSDIGWSREILDLHASRSSTKFIELLKEYLVSDKWRNLQEKVNCLEGLGWWEEDELPSLEGIRGYIFFIYFLFFL